MAKYLNNKKIWDNCRDALQKRMLGNSSVSLTGKANRTIAASMKVLEKAGFHKCGIFRKACFKNGKFVDCHCYEFVNLKKIN